MRLLIPALAFLVLQQPEDVSVVTGRVLDKATGQPIAGARVTARRAEPGAGDRVSLVTGPNGEFRAEFRGRVACGVEVEAKGYAPVSGLGPSNLFDVTPEKPRTDIVFRLAREVSLSGRVVDAETGQPVPNVRVEASTYRTLGAHRTLVGAGFTRSDDQGRFTIAKIAAGEYYLEVPAANVVRLPKPRPIDEFRDYTATIHARTWYPGVERLEEAVPLSVGNAPITAIELPVARQKAAAIRGRVLADAPGDVVLMLVRLERRVANTKGSSAGLGKVKTGEEFEIDGITPCTCYLVAAPSGDPSKVAALRLDMGETNREGLVLDIRPHVTLHGRVRIEGREERADQPALPGYAVRVSLLPEPPFFAGFLDGLKQIARRIEPAPVSAQVGSFSVAGLVSTEHRLRVSGMPAGYAVSEVRYNGRDCPYGMVPVDAAADAQNLEVRFAPAGSILAAVTDRGRPLAGATVVLAPDSAPASELHTGSELRQGKAGPDGKAVIPVLLPGVYRVIAYEPGAPWADDPMFAQRLKNGRRVEVTVNQQAIAEIRVESR